MRARAHKTMPENFSSTLHRGHRPHLNPIYRKTFKNMVGKVPTNLPPNHPVCMCP